MDEEDLAEELRRESEDPRDLAAVETSQPAPLERREDEASPVRSWLMIGGVLALLGGGVAFLLWGTEASDAFVYSQYVDEVVTHPDEYRDRELRVEGQLRQGSVVFESEPSCEHRFTLQREGSSLDVLFPRCVVPDTFRDDMPMDVVVQGRLQADGSFLANEVIPRCPSKYEMQERQQNGEEMPHGAVPGTPT